VQAVLARLAALASLRSQGGIGVSLYVKVEVQEVNYLDIEKRDTPIPPCERSESVISKEKERDMERISGNFDKA